jgi:hypothetical protein
MADLFMGAAAAAVAAIDFGNAVVPVLSTASDLSMRTALVGEGQLDTVWASRALRYAKCARESAATQGDTITVRQLDDRIRSISRELELNATAGSSRPG